MGGSTVDLRKSLAICEYPVCLFIHCLKMEDRLGQEVIWIKRHFLSSKYCFFLHPVQFHTIWKHGLQTGNRGLVWYMIHIG